MIVINYPHKTIQNLQNPFQIFKTRLKHSAKSRLISSVSVNFLEVNFVRFIVWQGNFYSQS